MIAANPVTPPPIIELVAGLPDDLVVGEFVCRIEHQQCYCIAGWMLHEAGYTDEELDQLARLDDDIWTSLVGSLYAIPVDLVTDLVQCNDTNESGIYDGLVSKDGREEIIQQLMELVTYD